MITSKYFKEKEFKACTPACSLQDMQQHTMTRLDNAREIAGIPFIMNSAFRSVKWEKAHGRTGDGSHPHGCGIDIRCNASRNRYKIIAACLQAGFTRIGIAKTYVHVDDDPEKDPCVVWHYYD